jgi:hypothetical protein
MPRVTVTTDDGEVIDSWTRTDLADYDFSKPIAREDFAIDVFAAIATAQRKEELNDNAETCRLLRTR